MAKKFDLNDDTVAVVIGSGAGGGTLSNELAQKGINVVCLEAGKRYTTDDFVNDEWALFANSVVGQKNNLWKLESCYRFSRITFMDCEECWWFYYIGQEHPLDFKSMNLK